jgi:hypothetical protein
VLHPLAEQALPTNGGRDGTETRVEGEDIQCGDQMILAISSKANRPARGRRPEGSP